MFKIQGNISVFIFRFAGTVCVCVCVCVFANVRSVGQGPLMHHVIITQAVVFLLYPSVHPPCLCFSQCAPCLFTLYPLYIFNRTFQPTPLLLLP